ncbi:MAG: methyltransferase domain-containing protein, partial [Planctomycetota bacterium]
NVNHRQTGPPARRYRRNLQIRQRQPEWMDDPQLDAGLHAAALAGLRRIHWFIGTAGALWGAVRRAAGGRGVGGAEVGGGVRAGAGVSGGGGTVSGVLRILDLASGGGDLAVAIAERCRASGLAAVVHGCDISGTAVARARHLAEERGVSGVEFFRLDVLEDAWPESRYDVVMNSLFLHHLSEESGLHLLRRMRESGGLVVVDDLLRTQAGYWLAWVGCHLLSRSPVVHFDGPVSVESALSWAEVLGLAERAGLSGASVRCHWPERFLLTWRESGRSASGVGR